jgi:PHD/YefM family antitoxin component YafN of YafNO toxin-antitoxin module
MLHVDDIRSLTDFQRGAKAHIARLKKSGRPEVLTVNGKAKVVVQDAVAYQRLLDQVEEAATIAGIERGLEESARGEGRPMREFLDEIRRNSRMRRKA